MSPDPQFDDPDVPDYHVEPVLRTRRIEIVDQCGLTRMVVGELPSPSREQSEFGVVSLDHEGRRRAWLTLSPLGPALAFDHAGNAAVEVGVNDAGAEALHPGAYLVLSDRTGLSIGWWVEDDGTTTMRTGRPDPPRGGA